MLRHWDMSQPEFTVALVGRPNVGSPRSSNRMARKRRAIRSTSRGSTRDLVAEPVEYDGRRFPFFVDTGGYMTGAGEDDLLPKIRGQVCGRSTSPTLVVFLVDSRDGLLPLDKEIRGHAAGAGKGGPARGEQGGREGRQGKGSPSSTPSPSKRSTPFRPSTAPGCPNCSRRFVARIPTGPTRGGDGRDGRRSSRIAVVGRPNVGKSTLVNTLAGFERVIASEVPGTTRDAIDVKVERDGRTYLLIDTAGIRAKRRPKGRSRFFSVMKSLDSIKRCDLAILLIDGPGGLTHQDRQVLRYILDEERAVVVAANKADAWTRRRRAGKGLHAIAEGSNTHPSRPSFPTVATSGKGFQQLFRKIEEASAKLPPPRPDRRAEPDGGIVPLHGPDPVPHGEEPRVLHDAGRGRAASFAVFVKKPEGDPGLVHPLPAEPKIRDRFGFEGSPVRIVYRER